MEKIYISELAQEITPTSSILATRFTGKRFWNVLYDTLSKYDSQVTVQLSFSGIDIMDASFADEVFGRFAVTIARKKYAYCYFILSDLNETCEENLEMALSTRIEREPVDIPNLRNCVLLLLKDAKLSLIGKYENHVQETFSLLMSKETMTARDASDLFDISLNAASTRLKTVADLGLVRRSEVRDSQGKQYIYHSLP